METIGARLRKARQKKSLTLEDARRELKVHPNILKSLEENTAHESLSPVYIRSFLRTYARYLGLNAGKIVEEYSEKYEQAPVQVLQLGEEAELINRIKRYAPLAAKISAGILILIVVMFTTTRAIRFVKVNVGRKLSGGAVKKRKTALPAPTAKKPSINIPRSQPLNLVVKAKDKVWLEIKSDGELISRNVLSKGSVEAWKAKEKIELWVGKADALELILNGIPLGSPGKGVKKGILITHKGMKLP